MTVNRAEPRPKVADSGGYWQAELCLAIVCLAWGSTFVLVKNALRDISPVLFLCLRFSIATGALAVVYWLRGGRFGAGGIRAGFLTGFFLFVGYLFQTVGLRFTSAAMSGFITGLYIVFVPVFAAVVYRRMPVFAEWVGISLATVGMGLLTLQSETLKPGRGELLTLGCALAFAVHILLLGRFSKAMNTDWLSLLQIASCALASLLCLPLIEVPKVVWSTPVVIAVLVTAFLATAMAFWLQTWAQARTTPTRAALIFSLEPVFAWAASWLLEGEVLTSRAVAGAGCILAGILLVELKPTRGD